MLDLKTKHDFTPERGWWLSDPSSDRKAFGVVLHLKNGVWTVARTLHNSPAALAGVAADEHFLSVDNYELSEGRGDMHELHSLLLADEATQHQVAFRAGGRTLTRALSKASLRQLLEMDFDNGGAIAGYCAGCRTCRPVTIGATGCNSGCPGNGCTVG